MDGEAATTGEGGREEGDEEVTAANADAESLLLREGRLASYVASAVEDAGDAGVTPLDDGIEKGREDKGALTVEEDEDEEKENAGDDKEEVAGTDDVEAGEGREAAASETARNLARIFATKSSFYFDDII